jgi:hypothetical protein
MFTDDCLIFINANSASARTLDEILHIYNDASIQCVNQEKSTLFFSPCTPDAHKEAVKACLNIQSEAFSEKYLGLSTVDQ